MIFQWHPNIVVEQVGQEFLFLDSESAAIHRFPQDFSDIVYSVSNGLPVDEKHPKVTALRDAQLVRPASGGSLSRRRLVTGGVSAIAGGVAVSLAMPVAAVASSQTFTLPNNLFFWYGSSPLTILTGSGLASFGVFELGDPWTLSFRNGPTTFTSVAQVTEDSGELVLIFTSNIPGPNSLDPFEGQLAGPNGEQSEPFLVSPAQR